MRIWYNWLQRNKKRCLIALLNLTISVTCLTAVADWCKPNKAIVQYNLTRLEWSIIRHEGIAPYLYKDTENYYTVGFGTNVDEKSGHGLNVSEMIFLMRNDIAECRHELAPFSWYKDQSPGRKEALVELCYNMGMPNLLTFKKMLAALKAHNYQQATLELLDSKWATQVGKDRRNDIAYMIDVGYVN